ncbi:hypothetical protein FHY19_004334 [Xanthomonas arboricola]|nr:hypothetical protein [Xanthomonas sp. 4461]
MGRARKALAFIDRMVAHDIRFPEVSGSIAAHAYSVRYFTAASGGVNVGRGDKPQSAARHGTYHAMQASDGTTPSRQDNAEHDAK